MTIREKIPWLTKKYECVGCNLDLTVTGASWSVMYFCPDCGLELIPVGKRIEFHLTNYKGE